MEIKNLESIFPGIEDNSNNNHGDSKHGNINKDGYIYHITQQCWNHKNYYSFESARYRDYLLKNICSKTGIVPLINVTMPNHSHDVLYSKDFSKIQSLYSLLNCRVSRFVKKDRQTILNKETALVFQQRPTYTPVENRSQLFYLVYYLFHNDDFLRESGKVAPYSCFADWAKGNFSGYNPSFFEKLFGLSVTDIINLCNTLSKEEFRAYGIKKYAKYENKDAILFKNPNTHC